VDELPAAIEGRPYRAVVAAIGGMPPLHFTLVSRTNCEEFTLDGTGTVTGRPTNVNHASFGFTIADAIGQTSLFQSVSIEVVGIAHLQRLRNPSQITSTVETDQRLATSFQEWLKAKGVFAGSVDGVFGQNSWIALQKLLSTAGHFDGQIDGISGPKTRVGIKSWQRDLKVPETGELDQATADAVLLLKQ
jgi:hypothetical protein